jgi:hypothetical protein
MTVWCTVVPHSRNSVALIKENFLVGNYIRLYLAPSDISQVLSSYIIDDII